MKTHRVVFSRKSNENSTTPMYPTSANPDAVDLEATGSFCLSSDDDRLVTDKLYAVREVTLPDFLSVAEWVSNMVEYKYLWGLGADPEWSAEWYRGLLRLSSCEQKLAAIKLLKTKTFRSEFRASLAAQLKTWLETPFDERQYASPFSRGQWNCLLNNYICIEARRTSESLYRNRNYTGIAA